MKEIYVVDENGTLQKISAGVESYSELPDVPINTEHKNTILSEEEIVNFCETHEQGIYQIVSAQSGNEILMIDNSIENLGRRYRRINVDYDTVWDTETNQWLTISDTSTKQLIYKFLNEKDIPESIVVGDPLKLSFYYYSNVGSARVTVNMNDITFTAGTVATGNTIDIDLTNRVIDGQNTISIKFTNDATEAFVPELNINGINVNYTPNFNKYQPFSGNIQFTYTCSGSAAKVVHFNIINSEGAINSVEISHDAGYINGNAVLNASYFSKGENVIETYMYAVNSQGQEIARTITSTYNIPFLTDSEPLLMVYYDEWEGLKQYSSISIPYYVWCIESGNLDEINFSISGDSINGHSLDYVYNTSDPGALVKYLQYNLEHQWLISNLPTSYVGNEDKKLEFRIRGLYNVNQPTNTFIKSGVSVETSSNAMQTYPGYLFNFSASDLVRPVDEWISSGTAQKTLQLNNFNWNTDGIQIDTEGNQSLHFSSAAYAVMSEVKNPLFGNYNTPYTLELDFKVSESAADDLIIQYYNEQLPNSYGLFIYPNRAVFKYNGGESEINYVKGERTHLVYTICNKTVSDTDPKSGTVAVANMSYLFIYINGILSQMKKINNSVKFPEECGTIEFNVNNNELDLYSFRGYSISLTSAQILQNYISDFGNAAKKEEVYLANNLYYDNIESGVPGEFEISFEKVKGKIPCLVIVSDTMPDTKDYISGYTIFYEKDGETKSTEWSKNHSMATTYFYTRQDTSSPWIRNKKVKYGGQGTSSLAYPRKNLKFKYNDKFYIKEHKEGKDKTFTIKIDYMDSSGANNIGNAQIMDNSIIRNRWINTPIATNPNLRVNLDGFPVALFWCKSTSLNGGVVQDANTENVFDSDKVTVLKDAVTPNAENNLIGEVIPLNPKFIGTGNFNYDKKAKALLGWDENIFQGFEFRGNSSNADLFRGFENFSALANTSEGFEWRWTSISDYIDDYHDGNLKLTIDGGYFDEDVAQKYSEQEYLADRKNISYIKPYNYFYIVRDGKAMKLMEYHENGTYTPINYGTIDNRNLNWKLSACEGISKPDLGITLEYGIKTANKDGVDSLVYQLPYGISASKPLGSAYEDGSHYYKFTWNTEHEFKFEYNTEQEYFTNINNWSALLPLSNVKALNETYTQAVNGEYVLDEKDGMYHLISNYPEGAAIPEIKYTKQVSYEDVTLSDTVYTWDFMKDIFKNWAYVIEAVNNCDQDNYKAVLDSTTRWGKNGNGLFVYDALLNYFASSVIAGLCDNFAKNMFMHSYDSGKTWSPAWYDLDTAMGLNNEGAYTKLYDVDFMDLDTSGVRAFNGSNSKLWELLYHNDLESIKSMYKTLRSDNYISYNKIMDVLYNQNIKWKAEALYNANAVYRYMEPLGWHSNVKPEAAQGNRLQLLKYWNKNRQVFLDSRYEGAGWTGDIITLRMNNTEDVTFNLVPDTNMYLGAVFNSQNADRPSIKSEHKVKAGESWACGYGPSTNLNTYIYGASHLLEVGDLSLCNSTEYSLATATNLRQIKIGDEVHPSVNKFRLNLSSGSQYNNLTLLDLTNTSLEDTNLNLVLSDGRNLTPALQTLKLKGSNIQYLTLGNYTPIKTLSLPNGIVNIDLQNLLELDTLEIESLDSVNTINIVNCPKVDQRAVLDKAFSKQVSIHIDNLCADEENALTVDYMRWLVSVDAKIVGGTVYIADIAESNLQQYKDKWPNLTIKWKQIFKDDAILGVENEGSQQTLTRIFGAKTLTTEYAFKDTAVVINPYDETYYGKLEVVTDSDGTWLRIPPFYTHYDTNELGVITGRSISEYKIDDSYVMNPEFIDEKGNKRDVYIACYLTGEENSALVSKSGVSPVQKTYAEWQNAINNLILDSEDRSNYAYSTETIWTRQILQDLFAVEFATTDSTNIFKGTASPVSGSTDSGSYVTYVNTVEKYASNAEVDFKYRGLENIWRGNTSTLVQGLTSKAGVLYTTLKSNIGYNETDWTRLNNSIPSGFNIIKNLRLEKVGNYQITIPYTVKTSDTDKSYYNDFTDSIWSDSVTRYALSGGSGDNRGLWSLLVSATSSTICNARLVKRIKINNIN